jgi:arylsulfatase A-like enzyme
MKYAITKNSAHLVTYMLVILVGLAVSQCKSGGQKRQNVIIFLVDDLGWRDLGCYGSTFYETPNVDKLASEGIRFTNAYASCHVCSPSRASLLTGKFPARLNLTDWLPGRKDFPFQKLKNVVINQQLPFEENTLAETLKANGYTTAIFGKWHLGEEPSGPDKHGFDVHVPDGWNKGWPLTYYAPFRLSGYDGLEGEYLTDRLTDDALKYIESTKGKPFFLYLAHFAVHDPIEGRDDLVEKYDVKLHNQSDGVTPQYILEGNPDSDPVSIAERTTLLKQQGYESFSGLPRNTVKVKQRQDNTNFAAMVESMDTSLGRVLAKLDELGIADNTIIIFCSDNGGMAAANFGNPERKIDSTQLDKAFSTSNLPLRGAKGWLYEGGIRVPTIIKWSGDGKPGSTCDFPVINTDFYPTILEMLGLPAQPKQTVDGTSIVPLLHGEDRLDRDALYWHFPHYSNHGMQSPGGAVRYKNYKLIEYYENGTVQLFNLDNDLEEEHDLSATEPEKTKELLDMLHKWRTSVGAKMMLPNPQYDSTAIPGQ